MVSVQNSGCFFTSWCVIQIDNRTTRASMKKRQQKKTRFPILNWQQKWHKSHEWISSLNHGQAAKEDTSLSSEKAAVKEGSRVTPMLCLCSTYSTSWALNLTKSHVQTTKRKVFYPLNP